MEIMNYAMVINQMWGKKTGRSSLWLDWLEKYWSKGKHWWEDEVKSKSSWVLKRLMHCKVFGLRCITVNNNIASWRGQGEGYEVKDTYNLLREHKEEVEWHRFVWNDFNAPRDSLNAWLAVQNKLLTRDRLSKWGRVGDTSCVLCERMEESRDHMYFDCSFSKVIWNKVMQFLKAEPSFTCWEMLIPWFKSLPQLRLKTKMIAGAAAITRMMNAVWRARNSKIFKEETVPTAVIVQETIWYLKMKLGALKLEVCSKEDIIWLRSMNIID